MNTECSDMELGSSSKMNPEAAKHYFAESSMVGDNSDSGFADESIYENEKTVFANNQSSNGEKSETVCWSINEHFDNPDENIAKNHENVLSSDDNDEDYEEDNDDEEDENDSDDSDDDSSSDPSDDLLETWFQEQSNAHNTNLEIFFKTYNINIPANIGYEVFRKMFLGLATARRIKLDLFSSFDDVVEMIRHKKQIIVLTGAGVSVSCGIPDFRSRDGIYSRLSKEYPSLPDPQAMFDINYFKTDPRPFYKFARDIFPGQFEPSVSHKFIHLLEMNDKLLRNYTQNIDTLERISGTKNVIESHGSFATATCTKCSNKVEESVIKNDVFEQRIPICSLCNPNMTSPKSSDLEDDDELIKNLYNIGIMKPDIVFFGEGLPEQFHNSIEEDCYKCDLLIVIGSSLKVRPVALIPSWVPKDVPQILINREYLSHLQFDCNLLGDSDVIINQLAERLGTDYSEIVQKNEILAESNELLPVDEKQSGCYFSARIKEKCFYKKSNSDYIFPGAEVPADEDLDDFNISTEIENDCIEPPQKKIKLE